MFAYDQCAAQQRPCAGIRMVEEALRQSLENQIGRVVRAQLIDFLEDGSSCWIAVGLCSSLVI